MGLIEHALISIENNRILIDCVPYIFQTLGNCWNVLKPVIREEKNRDPASTSWVLLPLVWHCKILGSATDTPCSKSQIGRGVYLLRPWGLGLTHW
jgi:hypothetical protein